MNPLPFGKLNLTPNEKNILIEKYFKFYENIIKNDGIEKLNVKIPRDTFDSTLNKIQDLLTISAKELLKDDRIKNFLAENPLPDFLETYLPDTIRVYSLLINALKQWISAESASIDRYLLGATSRDKCKCCATHCLITKEKLNSNTKIELHHPIRDGRPPIPLSKEGHSILEGQIKKQNSSYEDSSWQMILTIREKRHSSWVQLKEGCNAILSQQICRANAKSFANAVIRETGLSPDEILMKLKKYGI